MPRKTDSNNAADWLWIAGSDLPMIRAAAEGEFSFAAARSKLAEVLEKIIKAELIRLGWRLEKTHDLNRLALALQRLASPVEGSAAPLCRQLAEVYFTDRYPGYDFDDPDWPALRAQIEQVTARHAAVAARLAVR